MDAKDPGLGTALGLAMCMFLRWYGWPLNSNVYWLSELPIVVDASNFLTVSIAALVTCCVVTIYPAARAAGLNPVDGLRYE